MKKIFSWICLSVLASSAFSQADYDPKKVDQKLDVFIQYLHRGYVDKVDLAPIAEKGIVEMVKQLDPHSSYIAAKDLEKANEPLVGKFDGIGVSFQLYHDTITILDVIAGGPSEKLGIQSGDKIVTIDDMNATGDSISNNWVLNHLRGKKGTHVIVGIVRKKIDKILVYDIVRDKIPLNSVDSYFMEDKETGYIELNRFSSTSADEVRNAIIDLKSQGMKNLILDLRGNTGGYLNIAVELANEFLPKNQLVVYMEGAAQPRQDFSSTARGNFEKGKLIVLIDEGSASASEIVSGAVQDWDRALIIGRRSFGKGLVQRPLNLPDGSELRLTTARYYTPSGRCIQKPYIDGDRSDYYADIYKRQKNGELIYSDSVKIPDSLHYKTSGGRTVYGGGGIYPDIFVPIDTTRASDYFIDLRRANVFNDFSMNLMDEKRAELLAAYPTLADYKKHFSIDGYMEEFYAFAETKGVKRNTIRMGNAESFLNQMINEMRKDSTLKDVSSYEEYVSKALWNQDKMKSFLDDLAKKEDNVQHQVIQSSDEFIRIQVKAMIARTLYGFPAYFQVMKDVDDGYKAALKAIKDEKMFKAQKINY